MCVGFRLQFTQCRKETAISLPVLKQWQNSFMHLKLRHWRCHGLLSRSCVLNLSCNHFNQSCSSKGKITRALFCLMWQNRHYLTLKQNLQATCWYVIVEFTILQSQGGVGAEYFCDLRRRSRCGAKFLKEERTWSQKNETPSISDAWDTSRKLMWSVFEMLLIYFFCKMKVFPKKK